MLEYDRIDISEGIDANKANASKEYDIRHYQYFKDIGFKYELYLCNLCKAINLNNVSFVFINRSYYRIHFWYMSKDDAINIMKNSNFYFFFFFIICKNE